jgi:protein PhnA
VARGLDKHNERLDAVQRLGKDLARRARRKCELCEAPHDTAGDLRPHDTAPDADAPTLDALLLLCERCRAVADGRDDDPRTLRFLEGAVWSEVPAAAALARAMLTRVADDDDAAWARDTLEMLTTDGDP